MTVISNSDFRLPGDPQFVGDTVRAIRSRSVSPLSKYLLIIGDIAIFALAYFLFRYHQPTAQIIFYRVSEAQTPIAAAATFEWFYMLVLFYIGYFHLAGYYSQRRLYWEEVRSMTRLASMLALIDMALLYVANHPAPLALTLGNWLFVLLGLPLMRLMVKRVLIKLRQWQLPTVLIGAGENAFQTFVALRNASLLGFEVRLVVADPAVPVLPAFKERLETLGIPVIESADPANLVESMGLPHVVLAPEEGDLAAAQPLVNRLALHPNTLDIVPPVRGLPLYGLDVHHIFGSEVLLLRTRNNLARRGPRLVKRITDVSLALLLLVLLSPVFIAIAAMVRRSGKQVIFGHKRVGRNGKPFVCYKFRTMVPDSARVLKDLLERDPEARRQWDLDFKLKNDPRITRIGSFLRNSSLDELPQLFNVLKGEMSLVGPRPIVDAEVPRYGDAIEYYFLVNPGVTGLWQVSGRNDVDYVYRVFLDGWYVKNWSLWYDFVILLRTVSVVLGKSGAY